MTEIPEIELRYAKATPSVDALIERAVALEANFRSQRIAAEKGNAAALESAVELADEIRTVHAQIDAANGADALVAAAADGKLAELRDARAAAEVEKAIAIADEDVPQKAVVAIEEDIAKLDVKIEAVEKRKAEAAGASK